MHPFTRSAGALATAAALVAGALAETGAAQAKVAPRTAVATHLVTPLTAGIRHNGTAFVSENMAGQLVKIRPGHAPRPVFRSQRHWEVGGVSVAAKQVTFTLTQPSPGGEGGASKRSLVMHLSGGDVTRFANTGAFERNQNPDAGVTYGFRHLNQRCLDKIPGSVPAQYTGVVDTHPYSTALDGDTTYVGDAAGNDVVSIDKAGHVKLVTLLPAVGLKVTKKRAKLNGLPACAVGHRYFFEPVPTDVEVDAAGDLVVTTLTGATEAPGFGPQSRVFVIDPDTKTVHRVAKSLAGAVGVAVRGNGSYLVSELFGDQVVRVNPNTGAVAHYRTVHQPAAVERVDGKIYVTARVLSSNGKLLRFPN